MNEHLPAIALSLVPGVGVRKYWKLIARYRSPAAVLALSVGKFCRDTGLNVLELQGFPDCFYELAEASERACRECGIVALSFWDDRYPPQLAQIPDPPPVLYANGVIEYLVRPSLAIVGARSCTSYGARVAESFAGAIGEDGYGIISGLALGIDAAAHRGALGKGAATIAVLGCGLDVVYPQQNSELFSQIAKSGVIVSEYPLGTRPDGFRFPARNRIIAGLSEGVLVVEAAKRSGSLITAQLALAFNREVFAVPGQIDSVKSGGSHLLIQQGAKLVQSVSDIELELRAPVVAVQEELVVVPRPPSQKLILDLLDAYPLAHEELLLSSNLSQEEFSEALLLLELDDMVEILPGNMVRRISGLR